MQKKFFKLVRVSFEEQVSDVWSLDLGKKCKFKIKKIRDRFYQLFVR